MRKILVILGPTATGKTDLALSLAKKFSSKGRSTFGWNGELASCDSRQVYRGLDIGTGKMPLTGRWKIENGRWIVDGISIHMYDVVDPNVQYTVADYVKDANKVIEDIGDRGKLPVMVGGTGLYLKALLEGLPNLIIPVDKQLRAKLQKLSKEDLQKKLQEISLDKWKNLNESDKQNPRRLIRCIELALSHFTSEESLRATVRGGFNTLKIGLTAPREILYKRVDERVVARINQGMVEEAKRLHKKDLSLKRMRQLGLEYGVLADYLAGKIKTREELVKIMQGQIHGFVRRQLTWFKKDKNVHWFDISQKGFTTRVEKLVMGWYHQAHETES